MSSENKPYKLDLSSIDLSASKELGETRVVVYGDVAFINSKIVEEQIRKAVREALEKVKSYCRVTIQDIERSPVMDDLVYYIELDARRGAYEDVHAQISEFLKEYQDPKETTND